MQRFTYRHRRCREFLFTWIEPTVASSSSSLFSLFWNYQLLCTGRTVRTVVWHSVLYCTTLCYTRLFFVRLLYLHCMHFGVLHKSAALGPQYGATLCQTVLDCTASYCIILYRHTEMFSAYVHTEMYAWCCCWRLCWRKSKWGRKKEV